MNSPISKKIGVFWKNIDNIKLGGCFKVLWLTYSQLCFSKVGNI